MLRHVAGVAEIVDDVPAALAFYRDVLGAAVDKQMGTDYVMLSVPGVLHFGIWSRAHAAECIYGSREHAHQVPLGFTLEFEVNDVATAAQTIESAGGTVDQAPREEPWGQKAFRMISPGGSVLGFAETPWAREIVQQMQVRKPDTGDIST